MSGQLPAGAYTVDYHVETDLTTAKLYALNADTKSVTIQVPVGVLWCALAFGPDNTIVATQASKGNGGTSTDSSTEGFVIDQGVPSNATHMSVITGSAGAIIIKERLP